MSNVADASEGDLSNLSSQQLSLLRRTANAELTTADEAELERLLAEIPSARDVLAALTDQCEEAAQLKQLSSPLAPPSINLVSSIHQLSELRIKSAFFERSAAEEETDLPDLGSASLLIIRKVGHGGMGVVYEAFDQDLGRAVAVKLLTPELSHNRRARELLVSEAQSAARLNHENVVMIHSIHLSGEHPYIVQQFVRGETLGQHVGRVGVLSSNELFQLTAQLVRGLGAAHAIELIHRDLKPDNVLLDDETGIARIADFGLAGRPKAEADESSSKIVGTPAYMSPEQTRGEQLDVRSDLFSLGAVLYFAATGLDAFAGDDVLQVFDRVRDSTPVRISSLRNDLPTWWVEPVEQLLEKDPRNRYESSTAFAQDIEQRGARAERRQSIRCGLAIGAGILVLMLGIGRTLWRPIAPAVMTNNVPAQPVVDKTIWFEIVGDQRTISNMNEAIDAAVPNSIIRLHGLGAIEVKPIVLSAKPLTIEMALDAAVTVLPMMGTQSAEAFISTDSDLNLRGLRIVTERQNALAMPAGCTVECRGGTLTLDGCLIKEDGFAACISAVSGNIRLTNCQLESGEGLVVVLPQSSVKATLSNCWLEGTACFFLMSGNGRLGSLEEPSQVDIDHCTMVGHTLARVWCGLPPYVPIEFSMRDSIDLCQNEVLLSARAPRVDDALTPDALVAPLKRVLLWHEQHCIHLAGTKFLGRIRVRFSTQVNSLDIKTWDDWCGIWGLESDTSKSVPLSITRDEMSKIVDRHAIAPEFSDCGATLHVDL